MRIDDTLFQFQSYLSGQLVLGHGEITAQSPVLDIQPVWADYTGAGVVVSFDRPIDRTHPDLRGNYQTDAASYDPMEIIDAVGRTDTFLAGIVAADDDGQGLIGVAPDAGVFSWNHDQGDQGDIHVSAPPDAPYTTAALDPFDPDGRDGRGTVVVANGPQPETFTALTYLNSEFDISNDRHVITATPLTWAALRHEGGGLGGSMTLVSAPVFTDSYVSPGQTPIYDDGTGDYYFIEEVIPDINTLPGYGTTLGLDDRGDRGLSQAGEAVGGQWSVFAEQVFDLSLTEADYVAEAGGLAASGVIAGVAALMLEANPDLGWRDVQEILAYSADWETLAEAPVPGGPVGDGWTVNGADTWNNGGLVHNPAYGFGAVDVRAAVRLAETWRGSAHSGNEITRTVGVDGDLPDWPALDGTVVPTDPDGWLDFDAITYLPESQSLDFAPAPDMRVEHVTVRLSYQARLPEMTLHDFAPADQVVWTLTSPSGTVSRLTEAHEVAVGVDAQAPDISRLTFDLGSRAFRGENAGAGDGVWTLTASSDADVGIEVTLDAVELDLHGSAASRNDLYVFTDAMDAARALGGHGAQLSDRGGRDTVNAAAMTDDVLLVSGGGDAIARAGDDVLYRLGGGSYIEVLISGDGDDTLSGAGLSDRLEAGRGDDRLIGGIGSDSLFGGAGADHLIGENGFDRLEGGDGADRLEGGFGNDTLLGGGGQDRLDGGLGFDRLEGGGGNDDIDALDGYDTLSGGAGADTLSGNAGNDALSGDAGADRLEGGIGADTLRGGDQDDTLLGGNGADRLLGGAGADLLNGNAGADRLDGGSGRDVLFGGIGIDTFVFTAGGGIDTILDLGRVDRVALDGTLLDGRPLDAVATRAGGDLALDFGDGDMLIFRDATDISQIAGQVDLV